MQRFTLLHDGSVQGWQAAYLSFHVAARLGAPLQVLHIDPDNDKKALDQRAAEVETSGHAAGVVLETHLLTDYSIDILREKITAIDGFFLPRRLIIDGEAVSLFLDAFSCPLWAVSVESKPDALAVLVNDVAQDTGLISFTKTLSHRLQQSLAALVLGEYFDAALKSDPSDLKWMSLPAFTREDITHALDQLHAGLLFISSASLSMLENMPGNLVIYPNKPGA
jgi:hypothetical protein